MSIDFEQVRLTWRERATQLIMTIGGKSLRATGIDDITLRTFRAQWKPNSGVLLGKGFEWDTLTQIPYYQEMDVRFEAAGGERMEPCHRPSAALGGRRREREHGTALLVFFLQGRCSV